MRQPQLLFSLIFLVSSLLGQQRQIATVPTSYRGHGQIYLEDRAIQFLEQTLESLDADLKVNKGQPEYVKENLRWLLAEKRSGRYLLVPKAGYRSAYELGVIFFSRYYGSDPRTEVYVSALWDFLAQENSKNRISGTIWDITPLVLDSFALHFSHEADHIRNKAAFAPTLTKSEREDEETRVWANVTLKGVRPLLKSGRSMPEIFVLADKVMRERCDYRLPCDGFRRWVVDRTSH